MELKLENDIILKERQAWDRTCLAAGIPAIGEDTCARKEYQTLIKKRQQYADSIRKCSYKDTPYCVVELPRKDVVAMIKQDLTIPQIEERLPQFTYEQICGTQSWNDKEKPQPEQVTGLRRTDPVNFPEETATDYACTSLKPNTLRPVALFRPVPLTPEILERNGWKRHENPMLDTMVYISFCSALLSWSKTGREFVTYSTMAVNEKRTHVSGHHLKYVHEPQHALRIAGVNAEIEL